MEKKYDILRFIAKCILIPAAAVFAIYQLNQAYKPINDGKYLDLDKFYFVGTIHQNIQVANIGSSHGAYDFDYSLISEQGYSCFNFGNTSQTYDYDYALLKEYGHYLLPDSVLFIPVSYFSFNNEVVNTEEAEALNTRYYRILSPKNIPNYDPYVDLVTYRLPILSAGKDITKLFSKWFPNLPSFSIIAYAADNEVNVEKFVARTNDRYSRHFDNKEEYFMPERIEELYDIIAFCQENDITPVLITTPFSGYYYDLVSPEFLEEFSNTVATISSDTGVNYYDYSNDERFRDNLNLFSDSDHLNEEGARYFMEVLTEEVTELERFGFGSLSTTVSIM